MSGQNSDWKYFRNRLKEEHRVENVSLINISLIKKNLKSCFTSFTRKRFQKR